MYPIQKVVRAFATSFTTEAHAPADMDDDPSFKKLMTLPSSDISMMATWLTEKVQFLGLDLLSSMPDKVNRLPSVVRTVYSTHVAYCTGMLPDTGL